MSKVTKEAQLSPAIQKLMAGIGKYMNPMNVVRAPYKKMVTQAKSLRDPLVPSAINDANKAEVVEELLKVLGGGATTAGGVGAGAAGLSALLGDKKASAEDAYVLGFAEKCAAAGVDPEQLVRWSQGGALSKEAVSPQMLERAYAQVAQLAGKLRRNFGVSPSEIMSHALTADKPFINHLATQLHLRPSPVGSMYTNGIRIPGQRGPINSRRAATEVMRAASQGTEGVGKTKLQVDSLRAAVNQLLGKAPEGAGFNPATGETARDKLLRRLLQDGATLY